MIDVMGSLIITGVLIGILTGLVYTLSKQLPFTVHSTVYGIVCFYTFIATAGHFLYPFLVDLQGASALIELNQAERVETMNSLLALAIAAAVGAHVYLRLHGRVEPPSVQTSIPRLSPTIAVGTSLPLLFLITGTGSANLLSRSEYLLIASPMSMTAGTALAPCALVALGFYGSSGSRGSLSTSLTLAAAYALVLFAQATRLLALAPLFYVAGRLLTGPRRRCSVLALCAAVLAVPFLMQLALYLRGMPEQGLIPFSNAVINGSLWRAPIGEASAARNVFFGFDLTGLVREDIPLSSDDLWVSLTPLPGTMTDWDTRSAGLRVNAYTPYNATGELLNHGMLVAFLYFAIIGTILARTDTVVAEAIAGKTALLALPLLGLGWAFIIRSTQYNLRSCTRLVYYALLCHCAWIIFVGIRRSAQGDAFANWSGRRTSSTRLPRTVAARSPGR